jgi:hypothetical protein
LLILYADKDTLAAKLLSTKAFVGVGLISYSAYLWHQPLFAFARIRLLNHPSELLMLMLSIISIALAYFSWKYVEKPFRNRSSIQPRMILLSSMSGFFVFGLFGLVGHFNDGLPSRLDARVIEVLSITDIETELRDDGGCNRKSNEVQVEACKYGDEHNLRIALIGDSHASSLVNALNYYGIQNGFGFVRHTKNGCPFVQNFQSTKVENCFKFVENVLGWLRENKSVDTLIISHRLQYYVKNYNYLNGLGGVEEFGNNFYGTLNTMKFDEQKRRNAIIDEFRKTIRLISEEFKNRKIIIITPTPEHAWHVPQQLARRILLGEEAVPPLNINRYRERNKIIFNIIDELSRLPNVSTYRLHEFLCTEGECISTAETKPLYYDDDHLATQGAVLALSGIVSLINE